jgi:hypothetical protein
VDVPRGGRLRAPQSFRDRSILENRLSCGASLPPSG